VLPSVARAVWQFRGPADGANLLLAKIAGRDADDNCDGLGVTCPRAACVGLPVLGGADLPRAADCPSARQNRSRSYVLASLRALHLDRTCRAKGQARRRGPQLGGPRALVEGADHVRHHR
jgi:hypothetical protein